MAEEEKRYGNVPIGESFRYKGKLYKPVSGECNCCDLRIYCKSPLTRRDFACIPIYRDGRTICIFKLVENE